MEIYVIAYVRLYPMHKHIYIFGKASLCNCRILTVFCSRFFSRFCVSDSFSRFHLIYYAFVACQTGLCSSFSLGHLLRFEIKCITNRKMALAFAVMRGQKKKKYTEPLKHHTKRNDIKGMERTLVRACIETSDRREKI